MAITAGILGLNGYSAIIVAAGALLWVWLRFFSVKMDPREPPLVRSTIPYIGHMIGLMRYQSAYVMMLSAKHQLPIFTMNLLSSKIYIIADPVLVQVALRTKKLEFDPLVTEFAARVLQVSEEGVKTIGKKPSNEKEENCIQNTSRVMHDCLLPGRSLRDANAKVLGRLSGFLNSVGSEWETKDLYVWVRDSFTIASSSYFYGPKDPVSANPSLIDSLWEFETSILTLMVGIKSLAPKAFTGREALQNAFKKYFDAGYDSEASPFVKDRAAFSRNSGLSNADMGNSEVSILYTITTNAVPSAFWILCYIFADPQLFLDIRTEVMSFIERRTSSEGAKEAIVDVTKFNSHCPLLVSAYYECLRLTNAQVAARAVTEDMILSYPSAASTQGPSSYLLRGSSGVQMPVGISHTSTAIWGADADSFDPRRFLSSRRESLDKESKKLQHQGLFPFGGGTHLCPGRYLALAEILGTVTVLVAGFELVQDLPTNSEDVRICVPEAANQRLGEVVKKPRDAMNVRIRRRRDFEDVRWSFRVGDGDGYDEFQKVFK